MYAHETRKTREKCIGSAVVSFEKQRTFHFLIFAYFACFAGYFTARAKTIPFFIDLDFSRIFALLEDNHYTGPLSIEIEFTPEGPGYVDAVHQAVKDSFDYLQTIL